MANIVAVTGIGAITALGASARTTFESALLGRSGIRRGVPGAGNVLVAPVDLDPTTIKPIQRTGPLDRATAFALHAAREAVEDAGWRPPGDADRIGVYWGTGVGSVNTLESSYENIFGRGDWRIRPTTVVTAMANAAAAQISLEFGIRGPNVTYSVACASSAVAIGEAARAIRTGYIDAAIVGGADAMLTRGTLAAWAALRALASEDPEDASRSAKPFAADRTGFVLGEGAAACVLESGARARRRNARIYAEVAGYGIASDAAHIADPTSDGQVRAMTEAMREARIGALEIGYINAHGTGTVVGDRVEVASIVRAFGDRAPTVPVSSTKALHGHTMGAAGAIEFVIAVLALDAQAIPPTAHLHNPDPEFTLDFVASGARPISPLDIVMSNSFAFGGTNAVLVARRPTRH